MTQPIEQVPTIREELLREITSYLSRPEVRLAETTFGKYAVQDTQVVKNLRTGKDITTDKADRLRRFMAENPVYPRRDRQVA